MHAKVLRRLLEAAPFGILLSQSERAARQEFNRKRMRGVEMHPAESLAISLGAAGFVALAALVNPAAAAPIRTAAVMRYPHTRPALNVGHPLPGQLAPGGAAHCNGGCPPPPPPPQPPCAKSPTPPCNFPYRVK